MWTMSIIVKNVFLRTCSNVDHDDGICIARKIRIHIRFVLLSEFDRWLKFLTEIFKDVNSRSAKEKWGYSLVMVLRINLETWIQAW